jgi:anti-sigma B factor antagonist
VRNDEAFVGADAGDFWITTQTPEAGTVVLGVHGDADLHTAPELRERISRAIDDGAQALVLDLSETTFLDSMSLGVLLGAMKRMRGRGEVRLVVSRPDVRRIFEITLLDRVFHLEESLDAALDSLGEGRDGFLQGGVDSGHRVDGGDLEHAEDRRVGGHQ